MSTAEVAAMLNIAGTVFWIIMTEATDLIPPRRIPYNTPLGQGIFEELNEESWYPVPPPGSQP